MACFQAGAIGFAAKQAVSTGPFPTEADCLQACKEGACCESNGTCNVRPQCQCQGTGQAFRGVGTTCSAGQCNLFCGCLPKFQSATFVVAAGELVELFNNGVNGIFYDNLQSAMSGTYVLTGNPDGPTRYVFDSGPMPCPNGQRYIGQTEGVRIVLTCNSNTYGIAFSIQKIVGNASLTFGKSGGLLLDGFGAIAICNGARSFSGSFGLSFRADASCNSRDSSGVIGSRNATVTINL
jgi:hypothetical protein